MVVARLVELGSLSAKMQVGSAPVFDVAIETISGEPRVGAVYAQVDGQWIPYGGPSLKGTKRLLYYAGNNLVIPREAPAFWVGAWIGYKPRQGQRGFYQGGAFAAVGNLTLSYPGQSVEDALNLPREARIVCVLGAGTPYFLEDGSARQVPADCLFDVLIVPPGVPIEKRENPGAAPGRVVVPIGATIQDWSGPPTRPIYAINGRGIGGMLFGVIP